MSRELTLSKSGVIVPQTFTELMEYAKILADSDLVPKDFRSKPGNIIIALQMGAEVGLSPTQALQSIGIVNGRPTIFGDGAAGLVRSKGNPSLFKEYEIGERGSKNWKEWNDDYGYACEIKRKGSEEITKRTFTVADAKRAGLWGKTGNSGYPTPWVLYPQRMLQMRARSWAMRDSHSDVLKGLAIYEEAIDIEPMPEPDKAIISIDDFKSAEARFNEKDDNNNSELSKEQDKPNAPKISLAEFKNRIFRACTFLAKQDEVGAKIIPDVNERAKIIYHSFADFIDLGEPVITENENGEKNTEYPDMKKVIAKDLNNILIGQARTVWGKIKKHFKENGIDIKKELNCE